MSRRAAASKASEKPRRPPAQARAGASRLRAAARSPSPLHALLAASSDPLAASREAPLSMERLGEQFAEALASDKLEAALCILAACPALARMPCRKALFSALHWSCASLAMAPVTRALLVLGADPHGFSPPDAPGHASNTPLRWAVSSGNTLALEALIQAGALPELADLHEACRGAQGACALAILRSQPDLDPWAPISGSTCQQALAESARLMRNPLDEARLRAEEALAEFDRLALERSCSASGESQGSGKRRL